MISRYLQCASVPSPPASGIHLGPLFVHVYGLMYVVGIALAVYITARRWESAGGDRALNAGSPAPACRVSASTRRVRDHR